MANENKDNKEFETNQVVGMGKHRLPAYKDLCYHSDYSEDKNLTPEEHAERLRKAKELQEQNQKERMKKFEEERTF